MNNGLRKRNTQGICIEEDEDASSLLSVYISRREETREREKRAEQTNRRRCWSSENSSCYSTCCFILSFLVGVSVQFGWSLGREREHFSSVIFLFLSFPFVSAWTTRRRIFSE